MKTSQLQDAIRSSIPYNTPNRNKAEKLYALLARLEARIGGKKGAEDARNRFAARLPQPRIATGTGTYTHDYRYHAWIASSAVALAAKAGQMTDEHGFSVRGDHFKVDGLDFVPARLSAVAPYCDHGGEGLGLVRVDRTRVYAKSSKWAPSAASTYYLVGRNEAGTYFAHPVARCSTVPDALSWIWQGKEYDIIQRQGDIALIGTNGGVKIPTLPTGHNVAGDYIVHATHPDLPLPGKGQRIIVGRRAFDRANVASRD